MENIIIRRWIPLIYGPLRHNVQCFVIESMPIDIFLTLCTELYASVYGSACVFVCIMCVCVRMYICVIVHMTLCIVWVNLFVCVCICVYFHLFKVYMYLHTLPLVVVLYNTPLWFLESQPPAFQQMYCVHCA